MTPPPDMPPNRKAQVDRDDAARKLREILSFNLRMARTAVRMTQRELAEASGVSQKHISAIELAAANIGIDILAVLAQGLPSVTAADLLTPPPKRPS